MPNESVSVSKLKQLIGLQASNLSVRALARALGLSVGAVSKYLRSVRGCGISAAEAETLPEHELEQRVFGATAAYRAGCVVVGLRNGNSHFIIPQMATATLDKAGRVLIPKALRETLGLEPGDAVELDNQGDQVTLRPVRASAGLHKEQGIWVFRRGRRRKLKARDTDAVLHALRVIRDRDQFGPHD